MKLLSIEDSHLSLVCEWLSQSRCEWLDFGNIKNFTPLVMKTMMLKRDEIYRLFTTDEDPQQPIGIVALYNVQKKYKSASIWAVLGRPEFSKHGYTCRALIEILKMAFFELGMESINAWLVDGNRPSIRLVEIIGFHYVGRQRRCHLIHGEWRDRLLFDILASEFAENLPHLKIQPVTPMGIVFPKSDLLENMLQFSNRAKPAPGRKNSGQEYSHAGTRS
jgi:RimJ/RimL family protein N-acetyltransferase